MKKQLVLSVLLCLLSQSIIAQNESHWQRFQKGYVQPGWQQIKILPRQTYQWIKEHPKTSAAVAASLLAIGGLYYGGMPRSIKWTKEQTQQYLKASNYMQQDRLRKWLEQGPWIPDTAGRISSHGIKKLIYSYGQNKIPKDVIIKRLKFMLVDDPTYGESSSNLLIFSNATGIEKDKLRKQIQAELDKLQKSSR